jgi:hypothetical protein
LLPIKPEPCYNSAVCLLVAFSEVAMISAMAKSPKKAKPVAETKPAGIYFRPDADTEAALNRFIERQTVKPSAGAVAYTALIHFLQGQGDLPPPPKPAK